MPQYDPDLIAAIRQARAELFAAQAARRRAYLQTGLWPAEKERGASSVAVARENLDGARAMARDTATPDPDPEPVEGDA